MQTAASGDGGDGTDIMLEMKFISKVSTMGPDRLFIQIPKEHLKAAKGLKGKYVKVFIQEVSLDE